LDEEDQEIHILQLDRKYQEIHILQLDEKDQEIHILQLDEDDQEIHILQLFFAKIVVTFSYTQNIVFLPIIKKIISSALIFY
jgi:hypothetical protein